MQSNRGEADFIARALCGWRGAGVGGANTVNGNG